MIPFQNNYKGPYPFSEIECLNLDNFFKKLIADTEVNWFAYVTIHSHGEVVLWPWGYSNETYPPNAAALV